MTGGPFGMVVMIVAVAPPEGWRDGGLIRQVGGVTPVFCDVTTQVRPTVPLKPLSAETVMLDAESCPGSTANGLKAPMVMVKSWPTAAGSRVRNAATTQIKGAAERIRIFNLDGNGSDLNMSRFRFKYFDSQDNPKAAREYDPFYPTVDLSQSRSTPVPALCLGRQVGHGAYGPAPALGGILNTTIPAGLASLGVRIFGGHLGALANGGREMKDGEPRRWH